MSAGGIKGNRNKMKYWLCPVFGLGICYDLEGFSTARSVIFKSFSSNQNIKEQGGTNFMLFLNLVWQIVPTIETLPLSTSLKKSNLHGTPASSA